MDGYSIPTTSSGAMAGGSINTQTFSQPPRPNREGLHDRLREGYNRLVNLRMELTNHADAIFGYPPQPDVTNSLGADIKKPVGENILDQIEDILSEINRLEGILSRF